MNTLSLSFDVCLDDKEVWDTSVIILRVGLRYTASDSLVREMFWNADIGIGDARVTMYYWLLLYMYIKGGVQLHKYFHREWQYCIDPYLYKKSRRSALFFSVGGSGIYRGLPTLEWIMKRFIEGKVVRKSDRNSNPGTRVYNTVTPAMEDVNIVWK